MVYYLPLEDDKKIAQKIANYEKENIISFDLIRGETDHVLVVTDEKLAKDLKLEPKKFYAYFKPSYLNGFENIADKDLNIEYIQAIEGI